MVEKYIKDGKVAILHSKSYGCGWSSDYEDEKDRIWDKALVEAFLSGDEHGFNRICEDKYGGYGRSLSELIITWVPIGREFAVIEYDGCEWVYICGEPGALIA